MHAGYLDPSGTLRRPGHNPVPQMFARQARQVPTHTAITYGDVSWTYAELAERSQSLSSRLRDGGVQPGDIVVLTGPRIPELIMALLAVLAAGGVLLPIDPELPARRQQLMADQAQARWLLRVGAHGVIAVDQIETSSAPAAPAHERVSMAHRSAAADACYIFYTSGTTGTPNAVLGSHRGLSHFLTWQRETLGVGHGDRCAQLTGLSFDVVLRDILLPLVSGAILALPDGGETPLPDDVVSWIEREQISLVHTVPTLAEAWMSAATGPRSAPLRVACFAGEPLRGDLVERWRSLWPASELVVNLYGATETTLATCFHIVDKPARPGVQPLGRAIPSTQVLVLSEEQQLCLPGESGEIFIRSPLRSFGYLNNATENASRFVPNPYGLDPDDLLFRTGDLGMYAPDGTLEFLGRSDDQVKIRGVRVEPEEIGAVLLDHPKISAIRVVAEGSQQGNVSLDAYYVPEPGSSPLSATELRSYLAERLPAAAIPATFTLVQNFPVTVNGKLDRAALRRMKTITLAGQPVETGDQLMLELAEIWASVLNLPLPGKNDDFFELGGHSLLAARMLSQVRAQFGVKISLRSLLKSPVLGALAEVIRQDVGAGHPLDSPIRRLPRNRQTRASRSEDA
jgi:amino acid adenylation domain-containing protein